MKEAMNKFEKAIDEMMDLCKSELGRALLDSDMDERALTAVRMAFNLVDASMNLMKTQADMMIEMDNKLNTLIERGDRA